MKTILSAMFACLILLPLKAQDIPQKDAAMMDAFISQIIRIEKTPIESSALQKVFLGSFYRILPSYHESDGSVSSCNDYRVVIHGDVLAQVSTPGEDANMDVLFSLLKDDFRISNEGDAALFEDALDALYPVNWSDESDKKRFQQDGTWYFIRGDFFGSKKGFIVPVSSSGQILEITYSLKAVE